MRKYSRKFLYDIYPIYPLGDERARRVMYIVSTVFTTVGLCLLIVIIGLKAAFGVVDKRCTEKADAVVLKIVSSEKRNSGGESEDGGYMPRFKYTVNGREYVSDTGVYISPCPYAAGDRVQIMYDPDDPEFISFDADRPGVVFSVVFFTVGGISLAIGIGGFIMLARGRKRSAVYDDGLPEGLRDE